jgi:hypothetical protein
MITSPADAKLLLVLNALAQLMPAGAQRRNEEGVDGRTEEG